MELKRGMLVKSKAGRDKDCIYVIGDVRNEYVYLADGRLRTVDHPKRKKKKHVQPVCVICGEYKPDDVAVKRILKNYLNQEKGKQEE